MRSARQIGLGLWQGTSNACFHQISNLIFWDHCASNFLIQNLLVEHEVWENRCVEKAVATLKKFKNSQGLLPSEKGNGSVAATHILLSDFLNLLALHLQKVWYTHTHLVSFRGLEFNTLTSAEFLSAPANQGEPCQLQKLQGTEGLFGGRGAACCSKWLSESNYHMKANPSRSLLKFPLNISLKQLHCMLSSAKRSPPNYTERITFHLTAI